MRTFIAIPDLVARGIYYIRSRNLIAGAWNPATHGFIGIRQKFDSRYLFTEYHHDYDSVMGTVWPIEQVGTLTPGIGLVEHVEFGQNQALFDVLESYEDSLYVRRDEEHRLQDIENAAQEELRWQSGEGWRRSEDHKTWATIDGRTKTTTEMAREIRAKARRTP